MKQLGLKASAVAAVVMAAATTPLVADVTMVSEMDASGIASMADGSTTTYLKGFRMRTDEEGGRHSTIMDLDEGTMYVLDHKKKRAQVVNLAAMAQQQKALGARGVDMSFEATGRSDNKIGYSCDEYDYSLTMAMGSEPPMNQMTMEMSGTACLSDEVPGQAEMSAFYRKMAESGFFFSAPEQAEAQPGQARGMVELYESMAEKGVPLENLMQMGMSGSGPMAMLGKAMKMTMTNTVTSFSTDNIDDSMFEVPDNYKLKSF